MATTAPSDTLRVVCTSVRIRRIWRRPAAVLSAVRAAGSERDELVELVGDDGGVVGERVARRVGRGATCEPGRDRRGHHEGAERDRDHRDEQARPKTAGAARHVVALADLDDSRR